MFEAYKIGVRIGVTDATRGNILKIAAQFAKAQAEASSFLKTLRAVNEELSRKTSWASSAAQDFRNARREAEGYARAARSARGATGGSYAAAGSSSAMVANMAVAASFSRMQRQDQLRFRGYPNAALPFDSARRLGSPSMRLLSGSAGGALSMAGGAGGGGIVPPGASGTAGFPYGGAGMPAAAGWPWGRGGGGAGGGGSNGGGFNYGAFGRMMGGAMLARAGEVELGMLKGPIDEAAKYQSAVARFQLLGLGDKLNTDAIKFARSMNIVGTSMTDAVNFMTEAQGVFRESGLSGSAALAGSKLAAPLLAKIAFATSGLDEDSQAKIHTQSLDMLRFIESDGGLSSPARFRQLANAGWKAIRSSGGNVNWSQLRQFLSTSSVAGKSLSDTALFGELEPIIGELKGGQAGQGLMTAYSRINGLQRLMPRIFQHEVLRLGLWDRSKLTFNSQGGIKDISGNPLASSALFSSDPVQWYEKVVLPAYKKAGIIKTNDVYRENAVLFGNTGSKLFSLIYQQQENIANSVNAQKKTLGIDDSVGVARTTFQGQMLEYHAKMRDLQMVLGTTILPMLVRGLLWLNPKLREAAQWIGQHSTLTKGLLILFAGVGALAMISGAVVSIGGAFTLISGAITAGGGLEAGLTGVSTGLTALAPAMAAVIAAMLAWKAGSATGKYISDHYVSGTKFGNWLGSAEAHTLAFFGNKDAKEAIANNEKWKAHLASNYNGSANQTIQVNSKVYLDKREVGRSVTQHQTREAMRPQTGMSSFDSSMAPGPIGYIGM